MRSYGFYQKSVPLIFTIEGDLIGDGAEFVEHVRENYNKVIGMTKENQKGRLEENKNMIADEHRKKTLGFTLKEKIDKHLETIKKRDIVEVMNDSFFQQIEDDGRQMYCRETNLHREGPRTLNIVDEVEVKEKEMQAEEEKKAQEDMTYEEYIALFADHIEGKAENTRDCVASDDDEASKHTHSKKGASHNKPATPKREEDKKEDSKEVYGSEAATS